MPAELPIGTRLDFTSDTLANTDDIAALLAPRLNRHTFWCGQSGSGKTYALGVLLEQVMLHTNLPIVVLDPNSDFVHLGETLADAPGEQAARLHERDVRVVRPIAGSRDELKVRFTDLDVRTRAAILQLDPVRDAAEYNSVIQLGKLDLSGLDIPLVQWLRQSGDPAYERMAVRLENLGVTEWNLWAWGLPDVTDILEQRADATVVDLGDFGSAAELQTVALAVLDRLWAQRHSRVGRLVVIDEAHNLCPPTPRTELEKLLADRIIQIAAEGRKYGIWLLFSTQRPSKLHPNAISQCDNLALMKMSSSRDLAELGQIFGFAPPELVERSPRFRQGQTLFAGGFSPEPQLVQMGDRLTRQGGTDVPIVLR